jgi:hypothetical protein
MSHVHNESRLAYTSGEALDNEPISLFSEQAVSVRSPEEQRLEELRARTVRLDTRHVPQVLEALQMPDGIEPGIYASALLVQKILEQSPSVPSTESSSVNVMASLFSESVVGRKMIFQLNGGRLYVPPQDQESRRRAGILMHSIDTFVDYLHANYEGALYAGELTFDACYDIAAEQGLLPENEEQTDWFTRLFESHRQIVPDEEGYGIADILEPESLERPTTIGAAIDRMYDHMPHVEVHSEPEMVVRAFEPYAPARQTQIAFKAAIQLDPRFTHMGRTNGSDAYLLDAPDKPDKFDVLPAVEGGHLVGDILVAHGLPAGVKYFDKEEPEEIARTLGLFGQLNPVQQEAFYYALHVHPGIVARTKNPSGGRTRNRVVLSRQAEDYRQNVIFPHIPAERQQTLLSLGATVLGVVHNSGASYSREQVISKIAQLSETGLEVTEYDFLEKSVLRRYFRRVTSEGELQKPRLQQAILDRN